MKYATTTKREITVAKPPKEDLIVVSPLKVRIIGEP